MVVCFFYIYFLTFSIHDIEEIVQLVKAVHNVVVSKEKGNTADGEGASSLITLLASMSQTTALFTLLHHKDSQAPTNS